MQYKILIAALAILTTVSCQRNGGHGRGAQGRMGEVLSEELQARIYNGEDVESYTEFPFMVYLLTSVSGFDYQCGAAIISERWVLTAAHCVDGIDSAYLTVGKLNDTMGPATVSYEAESWTMHADYDSTYLNNDIALIYMSEDIVFSEYVQPIALPSDADEAMYDEGAAVTVIGWGGTEDASLASHLQKLPYEFVSDSTCQTYWGSSIKAGMVCTGSDPPDEQHSWAGDSGGPLFGTNADGSYTHLALVSWGVSDDSVITWDVNTHVLYYVQSGWFGQILGNSTDDGDDNSTDDGDDNNTDGDGDGDGDDDTDDDASNSCQMQYYATEDPKSIKSQNYPGNYSNSYNCTSVIYAPDGQQIALWFESFELEYCGSCSCDYVKIRDGDSASADSLGMWCGTNGPNYTVVSSGNAMRVRFHSDGSVIYSGFHAMFKAFEYDDGNDDGDDGDDDDDDYDSEVCFKLKGDEDNMGIVVATKSGPDTPVSAEEWGVVCNDGMGRREVNAMCRYFGYNTGIMISPYHWAMNSSDLEDYMYAATDVSCPDGTEDPNQCDWTDYDMASVPCVDGQQMAVSCADQKFEFEIYEGGSTVNRKGKGKFECYAYAYRYGMFMDLKDNFEAMVLNRDRNGSYSHIEADMKYKKRGGYWKGKGWVDIEEDDRCFICTVWVNDSMMFTAAADPDCAYGEIGSDQLKEEIWNEMQQEKLVSDNKSLCRSGMKRSLCRDGGRP